MNQMLEHGTEQSVEEVLDAIGDSYAREILAAVCESPRSAKELGDDLDLSLNTVYRRIETLRTHDLVRSRTAIADDGNHFQVFESNFDSVLISVEDDDYSVRIYRREDLPGRFSNLWNDLSTRSQSP